MDFSSHNKIGKASNIRPNDNISFQGRKAVKSSHGVKMQRFFPPYIPIDPKTEELGIELVRMENHSKDADGNVVEPYEWSVVSKKPIRVQVDEQFARGKSTYFDVDLSSYEYRMPTGEVGYRYVVYEKDDSKSLNQKVIKKDENGKERIYTDSAGTDIETKNGSFTVLSQNVGTPHLMGPMEHVYLDSYNVVNSLKEKKAETIKPNKLNEEDLTQHINEIRRNHFNKFGGTIRGLIDQLDKSLKDVKIVMSNPMGGGGFVSSHMYHPANIFRISEGIGNRKDFQDLMIKCFDNGQRYVFDGAFTSQGYEGLQLNHALKWKDSKFKHWFKNPSETGFELGVLPDSTNKYTGIRVVNPKGVKGYDYNPNMPSYIQFYDTRLVTPQQLEQKDRVIKASEKKSTDDPYEITTHQDSVLCNAFEIDPSAKPFYGKDYGSLAQWAEDGALTDVLEPENMPYRLTTKDEVAGLTGWDGNVDLVKHNTSNHSEDPNMIEGCIQVKNHMYNAARYWTTEGRDPILHHIAEQFHDAKKADPDDTAVKKYLDGIEKKYKCAEGSLYSIFANIRQEMDVEDKESIADKVPKSYDYPIGDDTRDGRTFLIDKMLDFPLEALDFSPEVLAVLSTPMITPRPGIGISPNASKTEIFEYAMSDDATTQLAPSMKKVYDKILPTMIRTVVYDVQKNSLDDEGKYGSRKHLFEVSGDGFENFTPYGKYFMEVAMHDIMSFLITEGLFGSSDDLLDDENIDAFPIYKDGSLDFGYADELKDTAGMGKRLTLKRLKINATSQENEAEAVAAKLKKGLETLKQKKPKQYKEFIQYLSDKYMNADLEDFKMAEAIIDQTGTGLNWRFDAAKDVADWDEAKEDYIKLQQCVADCIFFWSPFVGEILKVNPSVISIAEVTSLGDFRMPGWGVFGSPDGVEWPAAKPERVICEEIGATSNSNYGTYFGLYPKLFGQNIEDGAVENHRSISNFVKATNRFLKPVDNGHVSAEFINGSHVFIDNHDKPRGAHTMALDSDFYWHGFRDGSVNDGRGQVNQEYRDRAARILQRPYADDMSSKAAAVAEQYLKYFDERAYDLYMTTYERELLKKSIINLANGRAYCEYSAKDNSFARAEGFAETPYEISIHHVINQAEAYGKQKDENFSFSPYDKKALADGVRQDMLAPYMSIMPSLYEIMTGTAGIPTLFAGAEYGQTGGERRSKNEGLGCRNIIRHDWIEPENRQEDVVALYKRINACRRMSLEQGTGALSDGTPIALPVAARKAVFKTGEELLKGLEKVGDINPKDLGKACAFTNAVKNHTPVDNNGTYKYWELEKLQGDDKKKFINDVISELKSMPQSDREEKFVTQMNKWYDTPNEMGYYDWINTNCGAPQAECGGIYKYNDRGEGVITVITNAYMSDSPIASQLLTKEEGVVPPKISSIVLKDAKGNLIAEPGKIFVRKVYDEEKGEYVDDTENGNYMYTKEGKLINTNGNDTTLDSTTTFFYKQGAKQSLFTNITKPVG